MKRLLILLVLLVLCVSVRMFFFSEPSQGKQGSMKPKKTQTQIDPEPVREELLNAEDNDVAEIRTIVEAGDEFRSVREDWLKSMRSDADIDDAQAQIIKDVERAIQCGDLETLKKIRKNGFRNWDHRKFVLKAAETPFANIMKFLAENGADLDVADDEGNSALSLAAKGGNVETARYIAGWLGELGNVPVSKFPYLKDAVKALSLASVRKVIGIEIKRKQEAGEDLRSEKTRKALLLEISKYMTMERTSPTPDGYADFQKTALDEADEKLDFRKKQRDVTTVAGKIYPLYQLMDQVKIGRQTGNRNTTYISGRLEKITPRYIVVSRQTIATEEIPIQEQCKFMPELNIRCRTKFISCIMEEIKQKEKLYLRERWKRYLRTARMNGYFYDKGSKKFVHSSDIFDEELHNSP